MENNDSRRIFKFWTGEQLEVAILSLREYCNKSYEALDKDDEKFIPNTRLRRMLQVSELLRSDIQHEQSLRDQ